MPTGNPLDSPPAPRLPKIAQPPFSPSLFHTFFECFLCKIFVKVCENSLSWVVKVFRECERLCVCFRRVPPCPPCVPACCVCFSAVCRNVHELCAHAWQHLFNARAPASSPIHRPFRYPSATPIPTPCEPAQPPPSPDCLGKIWRRLHHLPRLAGACEDRSGPSKARMWSLAVRLLPQGTMPI